MLGKVSNFQAWVAWRFFESRAKRLIASDSLPLFLPRWEVYRGCILQLKIFEKDRFTSLNEKSVRSKCVEYILNIILCALSSIFRYEIEVLPQLEFSKE